MPVNQLIQMRRGTAAAWSSANPVLASGEFGYESDTGEVKIGDGVTAWTSLSAIAGAPTTGGGGGGGTPTISIVASEETESLTRSPAVTFTGYAPVENDVVVFFSSSQSAAAPAAVSGWVNPLGGTVDVSSGSGGHNLACMYHLVTASEVTAGTTTFEATLWFNNDEVGNTLAVVLRGVDPTAVIDAYGTAVDAADTATPHYLAALAGGELGNGSMILSAVSKQAVGDYATAPTGWGFVVKSNQNLASALLRRTTDSVAGSSVAATSITPDVGDEYGSISLAFTVSPTAGTPTLTAFDVVSDSANLSWTPTGATVTEVGRDGFDSLGNGPRSGVVSILPFTNLIPSTLYTFHAIINGVRVETTATTLSAAAAAVVWQDTFDAAGSGALTKTTGDLIFTPSATTTDSGTYQYGTIVADSPSGKLLRHTIPANELGPFIVAPLLLNPTDHALLEYDIRFNSGFQFRWGGKMGPGLVGVAPGHGITEPTSGNPDRNIGFSTRLMWHGRGDAGDRPFQSKLGAIPVGVDSDIVTYVYARNPSGALFSNFGHHERLTEAAIIDTWHNVKMEVEMNTLGALDGVFKVWWDDVLVITHSDYDFRNNTNVHIQAVLYDVHRGGGTTPVSWISSTTDTVDIRNVTVTDLSAVVASVLTSDQFTGADATLNGRTLDLGLGGISGTWTAQANLGTISNKVGNTVSSFQLARVDAGETDGYAEFLYDTAHGATVFLHGRQANDNSNYYRVAVESTGILKMSKVVAGTETVLYTSSAGVASVGARIGIGVEGSNVSAFVNRVLVQTLVDTSLTTGTYWGLGFGSGSTAGRVDNFQVTDVPLTP